MRHVWRGKDLNFNRQKIITKISRLGGKVPPFDTQSGVWNSWTLLFEKVDKCFCPRLATISLVPDSEGHKPKRNDNSCGATQQNK